MAFRLLVSERSRRWYKPTATINTKLRRMTLNSESLAMLDIATRCFGYVQIYVDDSVPNVCWINLCKKEAGGAKKINRPSPKTRSLDVSTLLTEFNWSRKGSFCFDVTLDKLNGMLQVDMNKFVDVSKKPKVKHV